MSEAVITEAPPSKEPKPKKGAEARIKELITERNDWRDRCEALAAENEKLRGELRELHYRERLRAHFTEGKINGR